MNTRTRAQKRNMRRTRIERQKRILEQGAEHLQFDLGFHPIFMTNEVPNYPVVDHTVIAPMRYAYIHSTEGTSRGTSKGLMEIVKAINKVAPLIDQSVRGCETQAQYLRNSVLPEAPQTRATTHPASLETAKPQPKNRQARREAYENSPNVRAHYAKVEAQRKRAEQIRKIVCDPARGIYLESDPSVKFAECRKCAKRYEILKGSPLLDQSVQIIRDDGEWWFLDPNNECPECSMSHKSLGWCMITDTLDSDSDDEDIHKKEIKEGRRTGKEMVEEYKRDGKRLFGYNWGHGHHMCRCTSCIRTFELGKYDHELKQGEKIQRFLRDPEASIYKPPVNRHGVSFEY